MKKLLYTFILMLIVSCNSHHYTMDELVDDVYGYEDFKYYRVKENQLFCYLTIGKDSTCKFHKDLHLTQNGRWVIKGDSILIKYQALEKDSNPYSRIFYDDIKKEDTLFILSKNKLKLKKEKYILERYTDRKDERFGWRNERLFRKSRKTGR